MTVLPAQAWSDRGAAAAVELLGLPITMCWRYAMRRYNAEQSLFRSRSRWT
jgi:hypothetical protein